MRVRRALWRIAGPAAGRIAPRTTTAYYELVTGSLARSLLRLEGVEAVYAYRSFALGALRPGRSDVDLVCVHEDRDPRDERDLLLRLRGPYRRHQALLPLDLVPFARSELGRFASWLAFLRVEIGSDESQSALSKWRLLAGDDVRPARPWAPDPSLAYVTEAHVEDALASPGRARARLEALAADMEREGLPAGALRSRDANAAIHAALALIDGHRRTHAVATRQRGLDPDGWRVETVPEAAVAHARRLATGGARSATVVLPPFEPVPTLLLEAADLDAAAELIGFATSRARDAARVPLRIMVTTTRLAEDSWRSRFRWIGIAAGVHVAGDPLAPRLRFPAPDLFRTLLEQRAFTAALAIRRFALGMRGARRDEHALARLALALRLLREQPPVTDPRLLVPGAASLPTPDWTGRALELWGDVRSLVGEAHALGAHPLAVD